MQNAETDDSAAEETMEEKMEKICFLTKKMKYTESAL